MCGPHLAGHMLGARSHTPRHRRNPNAALSPVGSWPSLADTYWLQTSRTHPSLYSPHLWLALIASIYLASFSTTNTILTPLKPICDRSQRAPGTKHHRDDISQTFARAGTWPLNLILPRRQSHLAGPRHRRALTPPSPLLRPTPILIPGKKKK